MTHQASPNLSNTPNSMTNRDTAYLISIKYGITTSHFYTISCDQKSELTYLKYRPCILCRHLNVVLFIYNSRMYFVY